MIGYIYIIENLENHKKYIRKNGMFLGEEVAHY